MKRGITAFVASLWMVGFCAEPETASIAPITITQVIHEVCFHSDSSKMMKETVIKSEQMVAEKWSAALPVVSASLSGVKSYGSLFGKGGGSDIMSIPRTGMPTIDTINMVLGKFFGSLASPQTMNIYSSSISVTQPLYTFGKIGTAVKVANDFNQSNVSAGKRSLQQLQLQAVDAFYRVVLSDMALTVNERSLTRKSELLALLDRNFKMGAGSKAQLLATQSDVKGDQALLITARENVSLTRMLLNSMMGRPINDPVKLDTSSLLPELLAQPIPEANAAVDSAVGRREDLKSLESMRLANEGGAKIFRAMYLPSIAAMGSLSFYGTEPADMVKWDNRNWTVGVGMQWNLFDGFANSSRARQYASDGQKLEIAHQAVSKMIQMEVRAAREECMAADSNFASSKEMLAAAQESHDLTNENFRQGSGQFVELQMAQERLRLAEMGFMNARYRLVRSRAALKIAMGQDIIILEDK